MPKLKNLITKADFIGSLLLPVANPTDETTLNNIINSTQAEYLRLLLGNVEYNRLLADLDVNGEPETAKYNTLLNGSTFVVDGNTIYFDGFKEALKYFVYYEFLKFNHSKLTSSGNKQFNGNNSENSFADINYKVAVNYNKGVDLYGFDCFGIFHHIFNSVSFLIHRTDIKYSPSCYNYMYANIADYPDWYFTGIEQMSRNGF
jgi:hypothetical protein